MIKGYNPVMVQPYPDIHGTGLATLFCDCDLCNAGRRREDEKYAAELAVEILGVIEEHGVNREKIAEVCLAALARPDISSAKADPWEALEKILAGARSQGAHTGMSWKQVEEICETALRDVTAETALFALTDQHVAALTRAIEAEGYRVLVDPETGDVKLVASERTMETAPKDGTWVLLEGGSTGEESDADDSRPVVAKWGETTFGEPGWVFAFWDGDWRSEYEGPTRWSPLGDVKLERGSTGRRSGFVLLRGLAHEGRQYHGAFDNLDGALTAVVELQKPQTGESYDELIVHDVATDKMVFSSDLIRGRWENSLVGGMPHDPVKLER